MKRMGTMLLVCAVLGALWAGTAASSEKKNQNQVFGDDLKELKVGDIVESVYDLNTFRAKHHDGGPRFSWFECDGTDVSGTELAELMQKTPDFRGRYPRGFSPTPPPDLQPGESGAAGTAIAQEILHHGHPFTLDIEGFDHGNGEHGPVWNDRPTKHSWDTKETGGSENRPNSLIVHFYIRAR